MITDLATMQTSTPIEEDDIYAYFPVNFKKFSNRGAIINAQGFPGAIEIRDSVFKRNMAYIKDVYIQ